MRASQSIYGMAAGAMTIDAQLHLSRVVGLGCWICQRAAEAHHIRDGQGAGRKASDFETIPLCPDHHRTGGWGVAFHAGAEEWERRYGRQRDILISVQQALLCMYGAVTSVTFSPNTKADRIRRKNARFKKLNRPTAT